MKDEIKLATDWSYFENKYATRIPDDIEYVEPVNPYETDWSDKLKQVNKNGYYIVHCSEQPWNYSPSIYGEILEWKGLTWERNEEKYDSVFRLHDPVDETRVIWCDASCITYIPDSHIVAVKKQPFKYLHEYIRIYEKISQTEKRYGYLKALSYDCYETSDENRYAFYATFELDQYSETYEVPDLELFKLLSENLLKHAYIRFNSDALDHHALYIKKTNNVWSVETP